LTVANVLVTLVLTMIGQFSLRNFKISMLLLVASLGLTAAWSYLPHVWFIVVVITGVGAVLMVLAGRNGWRQTRLAGDPPPPRPLARAGPPPHRAQVRTSPPTPRPQVAAGPPSPRAQARGRRFRTADAGSELLHPDATVTLSAERAASGVDDVSASLDRELIGLMPVKQKVDEIASLLLVDRVRQRFGLSAPRPNLHMCFTGEPGTGKTTVALKMADLLHRLGYLESGHLVHAMRDDLVGEFIGHTAPKTKRVLERAMGGVLFIDEAYYLYRASDSKDYGQECIEILLQVMENDRDKLVVVFAGYKDRMDEFFECNPGLSSRIAHHLDFAPYQVDELVAIGRGMLDQSSYYLSDEAEAAFRQYLTIRIQQPRFANARSVRNELERARLRHAHRLATDPAASRSRDDLMRLEALDILASPVFSLSAIDE
jgi:probable Rubsico expression protein CbbX